MATRRGKDVDPREGVYMISVAAQLAGMHPQTLRIYEARGLITPKRSRGNTRLYSQQDVERLRRIQQLTSEMGMNLAGVERVFELEEELEAMRKRIRRLEREAERMRQRIAEEVERVQRQFRFELVPYRPPGADLVPVRDAQRGVRIPIERRSPDASAS
ncbi:MAG: helix-turn-helix transcriptional regulator [Thermoleophilaceae bacterium]|nr:helix-turn-helix transcriptional regulator [Thermoleophilaceae bacterium]